MKERPSRVLMLVWAAVMIAVIASTLTYLVTGRGAASLHWITDAEYDMLQRYQRLDEVRNTLMTEYYTPLDEDKLMLGAIRGMTSAVEDVYTMYFTPEQVKRMHQEDDGHYHGIGILIDRNNEGNMEILRVYPDSPAEEAGLQKGDIIIEVDGETVSAMDAVSYNEVIEDIRGELNTEVVMTIMRDSVRKTISISRADVQISYVEYTMLDGDIGFVSIAQFTGDAATRFREALDYFKENSAAAMVIDLRDNTGGLLTEVLQIADSILPEGIIVYTQDRDGARTDYYSDAEMYDVPLAVLVNGMSASASEVLASSVQALNRGTVIGTTTYGKGIVQTQIRFAADGAALQLTTASYYDANGRSIHKTGITPDLEVALDMDRVPVEPDPISDNQLSTAIRVLREEIG